MKGKWSSLRVSPAAPEQKLRSRRPRQARPRAAAYAASHAALEQQKKTRWPVSRVLCGLAAEAIIPLGEPLLVRSRNLPERSGAAMPCHGCPQRAVPIWFCSWRGLPCRFRYRPRGALLPHPFTLTFSEEKAVCFLWRYPWGHPRRVLPAAILPWSPDFPRGFLRTSRDRPAIWSRRLVRDMGPKIKTRLSSLV